MFLAKFQKKKEERKKIIFYFYIIIYIAYVPFHDSLFVLCVCVIPFYISVSHAKKKKKKKNDDILFFKSMIDSLRLTDRSFQVEESLPTPSMKSVFL